MDELTDAERDVIAAIAGSNYPRSVQHEKIAAHFKRQGYNDGVIACATWHAEQDQREAVPHDYCARKLRKLVVPLD